MSETEPTSGFIKPSDFVTNSDFTEFTSIPSRGYCLLTRAKRHGRWWMLKVNSELNYKSLELENYRNKVCNECCILLLFLTTFYKSCNSSNFLFE